MQRLIILLAISAAAACSASTHSPATQRAETSAPIVGPVRSGHADVDLTGTWITGSGGEPAAKQLVLNPPCNSGPAHWLIEQSGDTVRAWNMPEIQAQGIATREPVSSRPTEGWVSGIDVVLGISNPRYLLHYDSTSGHLRGTLNGAPFWAVRVEIVRAEGCIGVP